MKNVIGTILLLIISSMLLLQRDSAAQTTVAKTHFVYGGVKYFRGGADKVILGSYGKKRTPITSTNYLDVDGTISASDLEKIEKASVVNIDFSKVSKSTFFADFSDASLGGSIDAQWSSLTSGKSKLVHLYVSHGHIKKAANHSSTPEY